MSSRLTSLQRIAAVESFRSQGASHLLATDLASRGLDIKGVSTVINYGAPQSHDIYLHRVGRTARGGATGRACTIAAEPDRKVVKAVVKAARAQAAQDKAAPPKIVSRQVPFDEIDTWDAKLKDLEGEVEEILQEEKEEKAMAQADMEIRKGENFVTHEAEIMSRPKRTWFESEKDKLAAKDAGRKQLNGEAVGVKAEKKKLSNKDKKRLDATSERKEGAGMGWKKGRAERAGKGAVEELKRKGKKGGKGGDKKKVGGGKKMGAGKGRR